MTNIAIFYFLAQLIERFLELIDWTLSFFLKSDDKKQDQQIKRGKMIGMWFLASLLGFAFAAWLDLNLMARLGVQVKPWIDKIFTAVILGSGTKPIHDILSLMGKSKKH